MAVIVRPEIAMMVLVVASPALAVVGHPDCVVVDVRRRDPECERQGAPDLLGLTARDAEQLLLADQLLLCVIQQDIEAIVFRIETGSLVFLVLGDVHAALAGLETVALLIRDIFRANALDWFGFRRHHLDSANVIQRLNCTQHLLTKMPHPKVI